MILAEALTACEFQVERIATMNKLNMQDAEHGKVALQAYKVLRYLSIEKSKSPYAIQINLLSDGKIITFAVETIKKEGDLNENENEHGSSS